MNSAPPKQVLSRFTALRSSIGGQITQLVLMIIILVTGLNVLTSSLQQRRSGEEFTLSQARAIGELAAAGSGGGLAFDDREFLQKSMQGIERLQSFELIIIKNRNGDTAYTRNYSKASPDLRSRGLFTRSDSINVAFDEKGRAIAIVPVIAPVRTDDNPELLGEVIVVLNTNEMNETILRSRIGILLGSLVAAIVCAIAAFFLVQRIARPIQNLSRIAKRVSAGDLMQRAPAQHRSALRSEVGVLTTTFNEMLDTLEASNEEMQAANLELASLNHSLTIAKEETEQRALELAQANEEIQSKNAVLEELSQEKDEFLGIAAHDLKNPLSAIQGMSDMLVNEKLDESDIKEMAKMMRNSSVKMFELIRNLLDVNALERGGRQFTAQAVNLAPILERIIDFYQPQAVAKSITLHFNRTASEAYIMGDSMAVGQVLDNLVSNAVKYSPQGKNVFVRIGGHSPLVIGQSLGDNVSGTNTEASHKTNDQSLMTNDQKIRVEVQDEGPGISPEDMKKLFGKFARLSARPTGGEHSTGLGLSIVKKMVEAMNGRVWCESELGKGATFIAEFVATEKTVNAESAMLLEEENLKG
ncbi:MAG: ATP-binding protein [Candidatus Kapabacteria bacterium]|jgi:signal transduction histidine kinase|nr:ATP-binding protein [Candidatus Kapabacteria bacterium]